MMMREAKVDVFCDPKRQRAAGFPVITASLSLDMVRKAETFARVLERNLPSVENYTGIEAADRYKLGFLAEFAFANVLKHAGRAFVYQPRLDGVSDNGTDFRVAVNQVTHSIDVKTASRSHHRYLMVPDAMWRKHGGSSDFYIGARLDLDELACELWGVATWLDIARAPVRTPGDGLAPDVLAPTRAIHLEELRTIESFVTHLDAGMAHVQGPSL